MRWLIVKQRESLNEYSYATYIYDLIADDFISKGGTIAELTDEKQLPEESSQDVLYVINGPETTETLMRLWYSISLPAIIKKLKADKIIYLNGLLGSYKLIRSPQIMLLYGFDYLINPKLANKWQQLSLKKIAKNVEHANLCFTYSEAAIDNISTVLNGALCCKIKMSQPVPRPVFQTIDWEQKLKVKAKYSNGEEYYLLKSSSVDMNEIIHYLKAFSIFKKWQKTSMKLILLVSEAISGDAKFRDTFSAYLFREDVVFIGGMERDDYHLLLASAYGFLMLTNRDSDLPYILEALPCSTPVITYRSSSVDEIAQDAPFYLENTTANDIAQAMIALYKSEKIRDTHIGKGREISSQFNFEAVRKQLMSWLNDA